MKRRQLLQTAAGTSVIGSALLSGCLGMLGESNTDSNTDEPTIDRTRYDWCVSGDVGIDTVVGDTVISRRYTDENGPVAREVVALNAETGSVKWSYETERATEQFIDVTVDDGIYLTRSDREDPNGVVVLNMDGTKRWTANPTVGPEPPRVANDTVYVTNGQVYAFDAASGDWIWNYQLQDEVLSPTIVDVTDTVVVETNYNVLGLDPTEGTVRWEFDTGEQQMRDTHVFDGITYVVTEDCIAAVLDGAEQWSTAFDSRVGIHANILGTTSDRVFVFLTGVDGDGHQLQAFDVATGERSWASETMQPNVDWSPRATISEDIAYLGGENLRAVDPTTGDERWQASVGDGPINTLTVIDNGAAADHTVFVQGGKTQLATFTPDGDQTWTHSIDVDAPDRVSAVGKYVFVGTESEVCALNRLDDS